MEKEWKVVKKKDFKMEYDDDGIPLYEAIPFQEEVSEDVFEPAYHIRKIGFDPTPMRKWKRLKQLWTEYFKMSIVKNDKFVIPLLLSIISCHTPIRYNLRGSTRYTRFHVFILQHSGTGKSQAMSVVHHFINSLETLRQQYKKQVEENKIQINPLQLKDPIIHAHITQITDAALVGSLNEVRNKGVVTYVPRYGMLSDHLLVSWDEGGEMFKSRPYNEQLLSIIQSAVDEPGKVSKSLSHGKIEYEPKSTVIAGSYVTPDIRNSIWQSGFAQRFFCIFQDFTPEEMMEIYNNLSKFDEKDIELEQSRFQIENEVATMIFKPSFIDFNLGKEREIVHKEKIQPFLQKEIYNVFTDNVKQKTLVSFIPRWFDVIDKAACNIAYIEGEERVEKEVYEEAFEICKQSILDVRDFMRDKPVEMKEETFQQRFEALRMIMIKYPSGIPTMQLKAELKDLRKKGKWTLGETNTFYFVNECWSKKLISKYIQSQTGTGGRKFIWSLAEKKD